MRFFSKKNAVIVLIIIAVIEMAWINMLISNISELREKEVPSTIKKYQDVKTYLDELRGLKHIVGIGPAPKKGPPTLGGLKEFAKASGIKKTPHVNQRTVSRDEGMDEIISDIAVAKCDSKSLYAFLERLESIGGTSRLRTLYIRREKSGNNEFYLKVSLSTLIPIGEKQ